MERVGLIILSIAVATLLLVGASLGAEWLQPHLWHAAQKSWFPLIASVLPGLAGVALAIGAVARLRRKRVEN